MSKKIPYLSKVDDMIHSPLPYKSYGGVLSNIVTMDQNLI